MITAHTTRRLTTFALAALFHLAGPACGPPDGDSGNNGGSGGGSGGTSGSSSGGSNGGSAGSSSGGSAGSTTPIGTGGSAGAGTGGTAGSTPSGGTSGTVDPGTAVALPLVVTTYYSNQGWFADAEVTKSFTTGSKTIQQGEASTGACGMRNDAAKGKCIKVVYTPPTTLAAGATGFVGVFFLTSLTKDHPELTPPAKVGEANWGAEAGKAVAAGATKISFWAAADMATPTATVAFKAGVDGKDKFAISDQVKTLSTTWTQYTIPLTDPYDGPYGVVGAFAWVITDTSKPATFYLDGIVWE